ncbi:MAG TPA: HD domain-containing protein, partial [Longimicrobiales bacterium]
MSILIRDPIWDTIRLDDAAVAIVDSAAFQRLRYIKQLGLAHLVYPGATHTRFDHAVGVYHLANQALHLLDMRGALRDVTQEQRRIVPYAALLHDIGHYPYSHALEELEG